MYTYVSVYAYISPQINVFVFFTAVFTDLKSPESDSDFWSHLVQLETVPGRTQVEIISGHRQRNAE